MLYTVDRSETTSKPSFGQDWSSCVGCRKIVHTDTPHTSECYYFMYIVTVTNITAESKTFYGDDMF